MVEISLNVVDDNSITHRTINLCTIAKVISDYSAIERIIGPFTLVVTVNDIILGLRQLYPMTMRRVTYNPMNARMIQYRLRKKKTVQPCQRRSVGQIYVRTDSGVTNQ